MKPAKGKLRKFKLRPRYEHKRSEGLTKRSNGGSRYQPSKLREASEESL
jgi:hypothetical protein